MIRKLISGLFIAVAMLSVSQVSMADDGPSGSINSAQMSLDVGEHYFSYGHFRPIGICVWLNWSIFGPYTIITPELSEYLPDLVVSVYNESGDDPWFEARETFDKVAQVAGGAAMQAVTGDDLTDGKNTSLRGEQNNNSEVTKSVDVIGSPTGLLHIPFFMLRLDTTPFMPYFQSALDSVPGRMGIAEDLEPETWNPFGDYIGSSFLHHWAYEFPRSMSVDNNNDYKASVSIALHAADIVTNKNTLHVVRSTSDSCGKNCAVANVVQESSDDHEIWEEVYPHDRHIQLGQSDLTSVTPLGHNDEKSGHGNYVFVVWRHYKGCIQASGHLIYKTVDVPPTDKR